MTDPWTERLSEYLDGDLPVDDRRALEAHLAGCPTCRAILDELRGVVAVAGELEDRPPERDLWAGIAARIGAEPTGRPRMLDLDAARRARVPKRFLVGWPQLAAAAVALIAVSAGAGWFVSGRMGTRSVTMVDAAAPTLVRPAANVAQPAYDQAIRELTAALEAGRDRLDTATVRVLEQSLQRIDAAIAQARRAVAADPASAYLHTHLADTMRRKLDLLRRAAALASAES